jgi:hypothetical protein
VLEALTAAQTPIADRETLERIARATLAQHRLTRIDGAETSPTGQAKCRQCHEPIGKGTWRIRLVFHEEGTFSPGGFLHLGCRRDYFETDDILSQLLHFSPALGEPEREALRAAFDEPSS